jgi:hypothetical protein
VSGGGWEDAGAHSPRSPRRRVVALAAAVLALAAVVVGVVLALRGPGSTIVVQPDEATEPTDIRRALGLPTRTVDVMPPASLAAYGSWRALPPAPLPARSAHVGVWTGDELVVWGGADRGGDVYGDGAAYSPAADTWRVLAPAPLAPRELAAAAWTGTELVVYGGVGADGEPLADGAVWEPSANAWTPLPPAPLLPRLNPLAVWTGAEVLVWGGVTDGEDTVEGGAVSRDGAAYDVAARAWRALPDAPLGFTLSSAAWTGEAMLVWGGHEAQAYDRATDTWEVLPAAPLTAVGPQQVVWTGREAVMTGRFVEGAVPQPPVALAFRPDQRRWRVLPPAPTDERALHAAVWTGDDLLVWGGTDDGQPRADGAALDVGARTWQRLADAPLPPMVRPAAVWTGEELLVWGDGGAAWRP